MRELSCQISAKYSPDNAGLFAFKSRLEHSGLQVAYPVGNSIIDYALEFAVTVPSEGETPFHLTELDFLQKIVASDVQVMYNVWAARDGYVGESTAIETAYALMMGKPVVAVRDMSSYSAELSPVIIDVLTAHWSEVLVLPMDLMEPLDINSALAAWVDNPGTRANLTVPETHAVTLQVALLTAKYQMTWLEYQRLRALATGSPRNEFTRD